ncbi:MAG: sulfatase-like hydrolase/transferase [Armatimonadota bacterium]
MPDQPNIIVLFSDQQRWDTMGCYGQSLDVTPNFDAMAEEGVLFENAFTCQPVCGPARSCLQTGKYGTETGCWRNNIALDLDETTLAHWLSEVGYEVGYIGKWHLASTGGPGYEEVNYRTSPIPEERRGGYKDYWLASDVLEFTSHGYDGHMFDADNNQVDFVGYRVDCQTDFVLDYLRSRDGDSPFFLFVSYIEPHHQNDHNRYEGPIGSKQMFGDFEVPGDLEGTGGDWRENFADYLGQCWSIDRNYGRIRDCLEELGIADNTLIIYTADHGSHFCTRNREYKRSCHDGCTHIPLLIDGPGFEGGLRTDEMVSLLNIPPTIMRAAGAEIPETMHDRPLQELMDGADGWRDDVFMQISESQTGRAVRTKDWKYSVSVPQVQADNDLYYEDFLYDLQADPHERNNLVDDPDYEHIRATMRQRLLDYMEEANEELPEILPADEAPE